MKKFYKIMGSIAIVFLIIGIILTGTGLVLGGQNHEFKSNKWFSMVINPSVEKLEYTVLEEFDTLELDIDLGDIEIKNGKEFAIEYALYETVHYSVKNRKLTVDTKDNALINLNFGFGKKTEDTYITVYVPRDIELEIKEINADMGNVTISDMSLKNVNIDADMGNINLKNVSLNKFYADADMGDIIFEGRATDKIEADADMGTIKIKGYLECDITANADMEDIDIYSYYNAENYQYEIDVDMGEKEINKNGGENPKNSSEFHITADADMGDVTLTFDDK